MKLIKGQVFSIQTKIGFGFFQFIEVDSMGVEYIRVLNIIKDSTEIKQSEIDKDQKWCCGFPLNIAHRRKIVEFIGCYELPKNYKIEYWTRSPHNVQGKHFGWHIVHRDTLERKLIPKLKRKHLLLSPHGVSNDTLIKERLEQNWELKKWR